jgi:hypothetical protein
MTFSNKTIEHFINEYILKCDKLDDILNKCKTQSEKGFVFERIWDLVFKFGIHPKFTNNKFIHLDGNSNKGKMKPITSLKNYITSNNVLSGNSGGCSDITLQNKETGEYIFMTCKYPKSDEDEEKAKKVDYYDVQKIVSMRDDNKEIYKKFDIFTLVPNKEKLLKKVKDSNTSSKYITKYLTKDKIFDGNELNDLFKKLKTELQKYSINQYDEIFLGKKEKLSFPFHQRLVERRTSNLIAQGNKTILWGCKPRSGKTYMAGNLIIEQSKLYPKYNVLIITPAPTETSPQFTDDLFKKYQDFDKFKITHFKSSKEIDKFDFKDNNIIVVSKQLLQMYINDKTLKQIKDLKLNAIIFDENHFGGTTDKSEDIIKSYVANNTVKIYLTATYNKSLRKWKVPQECQIFWDIEDEQFCKQNNINGLVEKHGETVNTILKELGKEGCSNDDAMNYYMKYPNLHILTTMFDSQRWDIMKDTIMESKYGFSMDTLFSLIGTKGKKQFQYDNEVKRVLQFISGDKKEQNFKDKDLSMYTRINNIVKENGSRKPFTQLWFLPVNGINDISENLKKIMMEDEILKQYDVYIVNSKSNDEVDDVRGEINKRENIAKENKKLGLIILAGNMLTLGITLSLCDIVFLMNDTLSSDKVMQMMYRSMTESKNGDKKCGFVVDLNISRVLNACMSYNIHKKMHNTEEKIKFLVENHLINIDSDYLIGKKINGEKIVSKLLDVWKSDPINNLNTMLKQIEDDILEMDNEDQKALNKYFSKSLGDNKVKVEIEMKDENDEKQKLKDGKEVKKESDSDSDNSSDSESEEEPETKISFTKDVLPFAIPFACMLTLKDNNNDFVKMLDTIAKDKELLEVFNEQSYIWWNNKDIIELIRKLTEKYIEKNSNTFNIAISLKMTLKSLIDKPKELLEFISERLKPKQKEKKEFGEVFTPMKFINDNMMNDLDEYYKSINNGKSIFCEKKLKWFDPANGMGNFPIAIYLKLMEGLKNTIKNEKERKKHILENMIYMSELNKKNVNICKQIFDIGNEYKLNLYEGDSLKLDVKKEFGFEKFDVIVGNPPYNKELTKSGALPLYNEFIEKYIDKCEFMMFIVPSRWFSGGKGLDKFRKNMLSRTDIYSIKHYDNASKIFGNGVSIEGGVNYFIKNQNYNGGCHYNNNLIVLNKYDIFVDSKYYGIIDKIEKYKNITEIYLGRYFGVESNDNRLCNDNKFLKCYVSQQKGFVKYIDKNFIKREYKFIKVITSEANGKYKCFGNIFIGLENEVHTGSYISFKVNSKNEAESLISYLKCRLPNFMLSIRKISQHINEFTCKWIPLPPLDKIWNDKDIYNYFKLSQNDIDIIENTEITGYKAKKIDEEKKCEEKKVIKKVVKKKKIVESSSDDSDSSYDSSSSSSSDFEDVKTKKKNKSKSKK